MKLKKIKKQVDRGDDYIIMYSSNKNLNENIQTVKSLHPQYEVLNITVAGTGGQLGGSMSVYVIWKLK